MEADPSNLCINKINISKIKNAGGSSSID